MDRINTPSIIVSDVSTPNTVAATPNKKHAKAMLERSESEIGKFLCELLFSDTDVSVVLVAEGGLLSPPAPPSLGLGPDISVGPPLPGPPLSGPPIAGPPLGSVLHEKLVFLCSLR
jgi:hypothetical protein